MKDKTDQIIDAATKVFVSKGFVQATTQEIAKVANVAEVTLYRKFQTKQNLFEFIVRNVLENKFLIHLKTYANIDDTEEFLFSILHNRLMIISQNISLVQLLITETLMNNLPDEINFTKIILEHLKEALNLHFKKHTQIIDSNFIAKQILSILLGHAILPQDTPFYSLNSNDQKILVKYYTKSLYTYIK